MTDQAKQDRLKAKLAKLASMTTDNGCTEQEALNAAEMLASLLEENGLTLEEIQEQVSKGTLEFELFEIGDKKKLHEINYLANAVAEYFECRAWARSYPDGRKTIQFFGHADDIKAVKILLAALKLAMESDFSHYLKVYKLVTPASDQMHGKRLRTGFMLGFCERVGERLEEIKAARHEASAYQERGTQLVVLKNQLVTDELAKIGIKLKSANRKIKYNSNAYAAGEAAGNRADLGQTKISESLKLTHSA